MAPAGCRYYIQLVDNANKCTNETYNLPVLLPHGGVDILEQQ